MNKLQKETVEFLKPTESKIVLQEGQMLTRFYKLAKGLGPEKADQVAKRLGLVDDFPRGKEFASLVRVFQRLMKDE